MFVIGVGVEVLFGDGDLDGGGISVEELGGVDFGVGGEEVE